MAVPRELLACILNVIKKRNGVRDNTSTRVNVALLGDPGPVNFMDVVLLGRLPHLVIVRPHHLEYESCARAEMELGVTLNWQETHHQWHGLHPTTEALVATVRKK